MMIDLSLALLLVGNKWHLNRRGLTRHYSRHSPFFTDTMTEMTHHDDVVFFLFCFKNTN